MPKKTSEAKVRVFLSDRAVNDLAAIELYSIENWGKNAAEKYLLRFEAFLKLVEVQPEILTSFGGSTDLLLFHSIEKHLAVCVRWNHDVLVLTIVHASRDLPALIDDLRPTLKAEVAQLTQRLRSIEY